MLSKLFFTISTTTTTTPKLHNVCFFILKHILSLFIFGIFASFQNFILYLFLYLQLPTQPSHMQPTQATFLPLSAPYEDSTKTYIKSFPLSSPSEIRSFFQTYGFVVISEILTSEELSTSKVEVYEELKNHSPDFDPSLENYETLSHYVKLFGIIGSGYPVLSPQSILNRQNSKVYLAYHYATGRNHFLSALERYGFMVPTKKSPQMKTLENWLHLDYNPLTGRTSTYGYTKTPLFDTLSPQNPLKWQDAYYQGIIALADCPEEVGGFHCVPGFHNFCEDWTRLNREQCEDSHYGRDPTTVQIPEDDDVRRCVQRIPIRKGCLLIWDGRLAHGNFPNEAEEPRLVQYVKLNAVDKGIESLVESQGILLKENLIKVGLSELGRKLFGLEKWESV